MLSVINSIHLIQGMIGRITETGICYGMEMNVKTAYNWKTVCTSNTRIAKVQLARNCFTLNKVNIFSTSFVTAAK